MIVEDEPASQAILKTYIEDCGQLQLLATCNNGIEALAALSKHSADVLFLDINMPGLSGLDFYRSLVNPPDVVFTTAYPEFAVDGFEVHAIDYLLKPFSFERFMKAVGRLRATRMPLDAAFILLQADKKTHRVALDDIAFAEAMGDYVKVCLTGRKLIVHMTLQRLVEQLPVHKFMRIHKSFLISLDRIDFVEGNFVSIDQHQIPIGQTFRNEFFDRLHGGNPA